MPAGAREAPNLSKIIKPAVTGTSADLKPVRVFDYDRLEEEADRIIESARKEAERIIEEAKGKSECFFDEKKDEITKLTEDALAKANEEGFKSGHEEGMKAGYSKASEDVAKRSETLIETISKILYHLEREKDIFEKRVVGELLELSFGIARAVVKGAVELSPDVVRENVSSAIEMVLDKNSLEVLISPEDLKLVEEFIPELKHRFKDLGVVELSADKEMAPGGCRVTAAECPHPGRSGTAERRAEVAT